MLAEPQTKLIADIADKIRSKILAGAYPAGERLKQERLAEEFGVSRTPIREALSRLEVQGLVSQQQRRSAVVTVPSPRDVQEIFRIRAELEGLAASLAARWMTDAALARLAASHDKFKAKVDELRLKANGRNARPQTLLKLCADFHGMIVDASTNKNLSRLIHDLRAGYVGAAMARAEVHMDATRLETQVQEHAALLDALSRRDPAEARRLMVDHILAAGEFVVTWLERSQSLAS